MTFVSEYPQVFPVATMSSCTYGEGYALFPVDDAGGLVHPTSSVLRQRGVGAIALAENGQWYVIVLSRSAGDNAHIFYTDALGCPGSFFWNIHEPVVLSAITISGIKQLL